MSAFCEGQDRMSNRLDDRILLRLSELLPNLKDRGPLDVLLLSGGFYRGERVIRAPGGSRISPVTIIDHSIPKASPAPCSELPDGQAMQLSAEALESTSLPFRAGSFDEVIMAGVLEYLRFNPSGLIYECHRVLKPDGFLMLAAPDVHCYDNFRRLLEGRNIFGRFPASMASQKTVRHFGLGELKLILGASGFDLVAQERESPEIGSLPRESDFRNFRDLRRFFDSDGVVEVGPFSHMLLCCSKGGRSSYRIPAELVTRARLSLMYYRNFIRMDENDDLQLGSGWYDRETGTSFPYRWSGPKAEFFLRREKGERLIEIRGRIPGASETPPLPRLCAEGRELEVRGESSGSWQALWAVLCDDLPSFIRFSIESNGIFRPSDFGGSDPRELGMAVTSLALKKGHIFEPGENDHLLAGDGWHRLEETSESGIIHYFRWTSGNASFVLIPGGGENQLVLRYFFPSLQDLSATLCLTGREMSFIADIPSSSDWQERAFSLPRLGTAPIIARLALSRSWAPDEIGLTNDAARQLGLCFSYAMLCRGKYGGHPIS
jgi:SAM-dependent methyltransferase